MNRDKQHKRLENELDKIIQARINDGFLSAETKTIPDAVIEAMEKHIREIVDFHNRGEIKAHLPFLFNAALMIKNNGGLHMDRAETDYNTYENYKSCKSRLEVMITAALNALKDDGLISIFNQKRSYYEDLYKKTVEADDLAEAARMIRKRIENSEIDKPKNESESIESLKKLSKMRAQLREIESAYISLKDEPFIGESVKNLRNALTLAWKEIDRVSRRASGFIMNQAHDLFQDFKATKAETANSQSLIRQKEALERYSHLFDSIGDEHRKAQIQKYIVSIEITLSELNKSIEAQKRLEKAESEKNAKEADSAYHRFLNIKNLYAEGRVDTAGKKKAALKSLKKSMAILKANGRRVKAMDIERFINSTHIAAADVSIDALRTGYRFYKLAFYTLLPVTVCLAVLALYYYAK